jgi:uncharacterized protein YigE (DUF2233 family)
MRKRWFFLMVAVLSALAFVPALTSSREGLPGATRAAAEDSGVQVRQLTHRGSKYTVVTADLRRVQLKLFWKDTSGAKLNSLSRLEAYLEKNGRVFLAGMNAGIFDEGFTPLGLHVERGKTLHALKTRRKGYGNFYLQPNGVFYINASGAHIRDTMEVARLNPSMLEATQSGPALVLNGKIHAAFQAGSDNRLARNAIGVSSRHVVQMVVSDDWVNFDDLARFMRDTLKCTDALYLDGNISKLRVPGSRDDDGEFAGMIGVYQ